MVFDATNDHGLALEMGQNSAQVPVQLLSQRFVAQKWTAVFG
jgi:hypothetical protein